MQSTFWDYAQRYFPLINSELSTAIPKEPKEAFGPISELIDSGGKRVRAVLCFLACQSLGGKQEDALPYAIILEMVHNFTLIHDDIEDFSNQRRSKPTLHMKYGTPSAINYGDMLFAIASKRIGRVESKEARDLINDTVLLIGEGQAFDILCREGSNFTTDAYTEMVKKKTGVLLGASCALGAMAAGKKEYVDALYMYGLETGTAFQILDDVLNLVGDEKEYGKDIGGDITEKKKTLMTIYLLEKASKKDKEKFIEMWNKDKMDQETVLQIIKLMKKYGAIEYATNVAKSFSDSAKKRLDNIKFKDPKAAEALRYFADFVIDRKF